MINEAALRVHIQHTRIARRALIRRLAAALGKEGRAVEQDAIVASVRLAGEHSGLKRAQVHVLFK